MFNVTSALRYIGQYLQNSVLFFSVLKATTVRFGSCFERMKALAQDSGKLVFEISRNETRKEKLRQDKHSADGTISS